MPIHSNHSSLLRKTASNKRSSALVGKAIAAPRGGKTAVFTVVLKDPMGASFISPREGCSTDDEDALLTIEEYNRTRQEEEELGINSTDQGTDDIDQGNKIQDGETAQHQCGLESSENDDEEPKREYSDQTWMDALNILAMHELAIEGSGEESVDVQQWLAVQQKQQDEDARKADEDAARHGGERLIKRLEHVERINTDDDDACSDSSEKYADVLEQFESID